jgi:hypothetical protein
MRIWLNGVEIKTGGIEAVSGEGNVAKYFDLAPFLDLSHSGTNTIAVMLNNTWQSDWDNVAFDLSLKAIPANPAVASIEKVLSQPDGTIGLTFRGEPGTQWEVQSSDRPSDSNWAVAQDFVFPTSGQFSFQDTGQNGRPNPAEVKTRFYRLVRIR